VSESNAFLEDIYSSNDLSKPPPPPRAVPVQPVRAAAGVARTPSVRVAPTPLPKRSPAPIEDGYFVKAPATKAQNWGPPQTSAPAPKPQRDHSRYVAGAGDLVGSALFFPFKALGMLLRFRWMLFKLQLKLFVYLFVVMLVIGLIRGALS
jgi:hypothetical protein